MSILQNDTSSNSNVSSSNDFASNNQHAAWITHTNCFNEKLETAAESQNPLQLSVRSGVV